RDWSSDVCSSDLLGFSERPCTSRPTPHLSSPSSPDVGPAFGAGAGEEGELRCGVGREVHGRSEKPRGPRAWPTGGLLATGAPGCGWRIGATLGGRPTGGWQTAVVVAVYSTRPSRWCQAPAGKTASMMTIWKVRITDWPVSSNVASTSTE